jgi:NADPH-dependent curcumin reductase
MNQSQHVVLAAAIEGAPRADHFRVEDCPMPEPLPGQILTRIIYLSLDPYLRGVISGRHMGEGPILPGQTIPGRGIGEVVVSRADGIAPGDIVLGETGWRAHAALDVQTVRKIDPSVAPLSAHLGVLGMPGLTAWAGMLKLAEVKAGDIVLVSAAAGPVGSTAGQIARMKGARAIGLAGGPEKKRLVVEHFGFDACIDYRDPDWRAQLKAACAPGPSVYFDNVGGDVLQAALQDLAIGGRVILCGLISQYNGDAPPAAINAGLLIGKRATVKGLVVYDFYPWQEAFLAEASLWLRAGTLKMLEDRSVGLAQAGAGFARLMAGQNIGKALVAVGPEPA